MDNRRTDYLQELKLFEKKLIWSLKLFANVLMKRGRRILDRFPTRTGIFK